MLHSLKIPRYFLLTYIIWLESYRKIIIKSNDYHRFIIIVFINGHYPACFLCLASKLLLMMFINYLKINWIVGFALYKLNYEYFYKQLFKIFYTKKVELNNSAFFIANSYIIDYSFAFAFYEHFSYHHNL